MNMFSNNLTLNQQMFLYWVVERECVRISKEADNPKPWSEDTIFQETYFCNIDREDDRVTRWIRKNYKYNTYTKKHFTVNMYIARAINRIETLEQLNFPYDINLENGKWYLNSKDTLEDLQFDEVPIWGNAYMTTTHGIKMDKIDYYFMCFKELQRTHNYINNSASLRELHNKLVQNRGISSFMSGQIIADIKNTEGHPLYRAYDKLEFCCHGPGSLRGLTWFWEEKVTPKNFKESIQKAKGLVFPLLIDEIKDKLCMQNLQNCFCEYDKYMRIHKNTGKSKRKYKGV